MDHDTVIKKAIDLGCKIEMRGKHQSLITPDGETVFTAITPSDWRVGRKLARDLRRKGIDIKRDVRHGPVRQTTGDVFMCREAACANLICPRNRLGMDPQRVAPDIQLATFRSASCGYIPLRGCGRVLWHTEPTVGRIPRFCGREPGHSGDCQVMEANMLNLQKTTEKPAATALACSFAVIPHHSSAKPTVSTLVSLKLIARIREAFGLKPDEGMRLSGRVINGDVHFTLAQGIFKNASVFSTYNRKSDPLILKLSGIFDSEKLPPTGLVPTTCEITPKAFVVHYPKKTKAPILKGWNRKANDKAGEAPAKKEPVPVRTVAPAAIAAAAPAPMVPMMMAPARESTPIAVPAQPSATSVDPHMIIVTQLGSKTYTLSIPASEVLRLVLEYGVGH